MTSSNRNIFRVTDPLCGEFTDHRWIPLTKASDEELWCFLWFAPWINDWVNNPKAGDLRRHRGHHDVIVIYGKIFGCHLEIFSCHTLCRLRYPDRWRKLCQNSNTCANGFALDRLCCCIVHNNFTLMFQCYVWHLSAFVWDVSMQNLNALWYDQHTICIWYRISRSQNADMYHLYHCWTGIYRVVT